MSVPTFVHKFTNIITDNFLYILLVLKSSEKLYVNCVYLKQYVFSNYFLMLNNLLKAPAHALCAVCRTGFDTERIR